ncbi:DUF6292 family protein (plasmid) [Microtetraspora malaysiensis]|uniref:DUF6292 family protein n=1 Tax=Microtetraspora malaysiensis TaxID=161358 RepID=UPI003D8F6D1D
MSTSITDAHEPYMMTCAEALAESGIKVHSTQTASGWPRHGVVRLGSPDGAPADLVLAWNEELGWAYGTAVPGRDPLDVLDRAKVFGKSVLPTPDQLVSDVYPILISRRRVSIPPGPHRSWRDAADGFEAELIAYATGERYGAAAVGMSHRDQFGNGRAATQPAGSGGA